MIDDDGERDRETERWRGFETIKKRHYFDPITWIILDCKSSSTTDWYILIWQTEEAAGGGAISFRFSLRTARFGSFVGWALRHSHESRRSIAAWRAPEMNFSLSHVTPQPLKQFPCRFFHHIFVVLIAEPEVSHSSSSAAHRILNLHDAMKMKCDEREFDVRRKRDESNLINRGYRREKSYAIGS